jgi:hypothetical protein
MPRSKNPRRRNNNPKPIEEVIYTQETHTCPGDCGREISITRQLCGRYICLGLPPTPTPKVEKCVYRPNGDHQCACGMWIQIHRIACGKDGTCEWKNMERDESPEPSME